MFGLFVAITIFAFVSGSYFSQEISSKDQTNTTSVKSAKSENDSKTEDLNSADIKINVESDSNEASNIQTTPAINEFKYPNAQIVSSDSTKLSLSSSDSPDKITEWYKTMIKSKNLSATSFVNTSTNGKVLNKLAADGVFHIEVQIQKDTNSEAKIEIVTSK